MRKNNHKLNFNCKIIFILFNLENAEAYNHNISFIIIH